MANDVANANSADKPLDHLATTERDLDAGRPAGGDPAGDRPAPGSPQAADAVKAEEKQLTQDEQSLETDREVRDRRAGDGSNRPEADNSAANRLLAFENEHLGKDAVRIRGRVERGSGSPYQNLPDDKKLQYVALERLVVAEEKLADARAVVAKAEAEFAAAQAHLDECAKDADAASVE